MSAVFSECRTWRYTLTRPGLVLTDDDCDCFIPTLEGAGQHSPGCAIFKGKTVAFIGLNPSTADETQDDPTIRRCVGFAKRWGYDRLVMLNAFAFRATNPKRLREAVDPVGPENDEWLRREVAAADLVIACWGNLALWHPRVGHPVTRQAEVRFAVEAEVGARLHVLGVTKLGAPKHPLYLRGDLEPVTWSGYA